MPQKLPGHGIWWMAIRTRRVSETIIFPAEESMGKSRRYFPLLKLSAGRILCGIHGPSLLHVEHNECVSEWVRTKDNARLKNLVTRLYGGGRSHMLIFNTRILVTRIWGGGLQKPFSKWGLVDQGIRALSSLGMWVILGSLVQGSVSFLSLLFWLRTNCPIFNSDRRRQRVLTKISQSRCFCRLPIGVENGHCNSKRKEINLETKLPKFNYMSNWSFFWSTWSTKPHFGNGINEHARRPFIKASVEFLLEMTYLQSYKIGFIYHITHLLGKNLWDHDSL